MTITVERADLDLGGGDRAVLFLPVGSTWVPGIVLLHERYGLVRHTLELGEKFAQQGYAALTPDLFAHWEGDWEAFRREEVWPRVDDPQAAGITGKCLDYLKAHPRVGAERLVVMGVCMSGRFPIVVASERQDVRAIVVLYGASNGLDTVSNLMPHPLIERIGEMKTPGLYCFGEKDGNHPLRGVLRMRDALELHGLSYRFRIFRDMPHGWLNDTMDDGRYRPQGAAALWATLLQFFADVFEDRWPEPGRADWDFRGNVALDYDFSQSHAWRHTRDPS